MSKLVNRLLSWSLVDFVIALIFLILTKSFNNLTIVGIWVFVISSLLKLIYVAFAKNSRNN